MEHNFTHITVLKNEMIAALLPEAAHTNHTEGLTFNFLDITLGGAGHTTAFIDAFYSLKANSKTKLKVYGFDKDDRALAVAGERLKLKKELFDFEFFLFKSDFCKFKEVLEAHFGTIKMDALCGDFGVSSPQLDHAHRGFSLQNPGPIDMRMDLSNPLTAKFILEHYSIDDLKQIFYDYGEEPRAAKLAQKIVMDRKNGHLPLENTVDFATYVSKVLAYKSRSTTHPATRIFQALRIEVNQELKSIETLLKEAPSVMAPHSKIGLISFHSLEDRLIKNAYKSWETGKVFDSNKQKLSKKSQLDEIYMQGLDSNNKSFGLQKPKGGITPTEQEQKINSRSRSARLRVFQFNDSEAFV